jgi:hypothetical protein
VTSPLPDSSPTYSFIYTNTKPPQHPSLEALAMSAIRRSKSEPSVAPAKPFLASTYSRGLQAHRPRILRHHTGLVLADTPGPSSATCSGYHTLRVERTEDPFSLGGFFPPQLSGTESPTEEWTWLRERDARDESDQFSQDGDWSTDGYRPRFDGTEDEETGKTIRREDKLGVLSLRTSRLYWRLLVRS